MSSEELEALQYPIGKFSKPENIDEHTTSLWINDIELFPSKLTYCVQPLNAEQLNWAYRPDGWSIKQVIHHCADSHMNAFIRFKLALTEESPIIKPYYEDRWAALPDAILEDVETSLSLLTSLHVRWSVLLKNLSDKDMAKSFIHPEHGRKITLAENIGMYAWHCNHHLAHLKNAKMSEGNFC